MVTVETQVSAPLTQVFEAVSDPTSYPEWLVGAQAIRGVERPFPERGARFFHRVGVGLLTLKDSTKVIEVQEPTLVVLEARARPVVVARVTFRLHPADGGTKVELEEKVTGGPAALLPSILLDPLLRLRNAESLRQLKRYVEERVSSGA